MDYNIKEISIGSFFYIVVVHISLCAGDFLSLYDGSSFYLKDRDKNKQMFLRLQTWVVLHLLQKVKPKWAVPSDVLWKWFSLKGMERIWVVIKMKIRKKYTQFSCNVLHIFFVFCDIN